MSRVRGRVVALTGDELVVHGEAGLQPITVSEGEGVRVGDLVEIEEGRVRVATPGRSRDPGAAQRRMLDPRRLRAMAIRAQVERGIRDFFVARGFREVRTPALVPCPGMEPHILPFQVGEAGWLQTSPEFAMKRLLCGGLGRIFQLAPVWRDEPDAPHHRREFVMLEWYRPWAGEAEIQRDTEELIAGLAVAIHGRPEIPRREGAAIDVSLPWPRMTVEELFRRHAGVELLTDELGAACARLGITTAAGDSWDDLYFRIWLARVEPALPSRGILVVRYPASQAALAVIDGPWARRFEVYAAGLELGNAFEELTDPVEQRRRFERDRRQPGPPLPEALLAALEDGMPPSGGIAVGVDRLAMLLAGEDDIGWVSWLPD